MKQCNSYIAILRLYRVWSSLHLYIEIVIITFFTYLVFIFLRMCLNYIICIIIIIIPKEYLHIVFSNDYFYNKNINTYYLMFY